ncbi:MAG: hypothetical protein R2856_23770 [Caldilineaceae bacterium]
MPAPRDQRGAADVIRVGVGDVGGITPAMKTIHPVRRSTSASKFTVAGRATCTILCAMSIPGRYYERGLLHPSSTTRKSPPGSTAAMTRWTTKASSTSQLPGLGQDINFDYIHDNLV